ncbi:MAG TPA: SAM-dependent methyltransferase [Pyrinomonadaceae bacterium]|nr:SAM-dependent methyltransferase [Pyrinomonadaceae bacterium]
MPTFRLSPYATLLESHLFLQAVEYGVFHQLTGSSLPITRELRSVLEKMRVGRELVCDEAELERRRGTELFSLIELNLLVPPDHDPFIAFQQHLVVRPKQNPAVFYRNEAGALTVVRVSLSQRVFSPSPDEAPGLIEEELSNIAARILLLSDGTRTLREVRSLVQNEEVSDEQFVQAIIFLVTPERQLIKLAPPGAPLDQPFHPFNTVPRNLFVSRAGEPDRNIQNPESIAEFHKHRIEDPDREFDWIEPTVNHAFRFPSAAFGGLNYGARLCDALLKEVTLNIGARQPLQMLEVGGGTGTFARSFLDRADQTHSGVEIVYHLLELSPAMFEKQANVIGDYLAPERHFLQDATTLSLPEHRFDLIIANEVIADFPVAEVQRVGENRSNGDGAEQAQKYSLVRSDGPDRFLVNKGVFEFIELAYDHLSPQGTLILTEYGGLDRFPVRSYHLNHAEHSIHFGHVIRCAEAVGFNARVVSLKEFLAIDDEVEFLDGQEEHVLCLNHVLEKFGLSLPYAAISKEEFEVRYARVVAEQEIGGF